MAFLLYEFFGRVAIFQRKETATVCMKVATAERYLFPWRILEEGPSLRSHKGTVILARNDCLCSGCKNKALGYIGRY